MFAQINRSLRLIFWSCLVLGIVISSLGIRQTDLWWQLPEGLAILHTGHLPVQPPACFGLPAHPYVDEYGLYEIILALVYRTAGFVGIGLAFMAVYFLIFLVPLKSARGKDPDFISLLLFGMSLVFMINRFAQRPEVPGVLCLVLLLALLRQSREISPAFLLKLCLLFTLWSNLHSSFIVGLFALFLWLADRFFITRNLSARQVLVVTVSALAAVMINPYGWHRIAFTFAQEKDLGSNILSLEMWPITSQTPTAFALMLISGGLLLVLVLGRKRPAPWLIILAAVTWLMSLDSLRHISFLAATMLALYAERQRSTESAPSALAAWAPPATTLLLTACCILALIFDFTTLTGQVRHLIYRHAWGREDQGFAPVLVNTLKNRRDPNAGVLCDYGEGSYLTFAGEGHLRPLLDSGQGHFDDETKRSYFLLIHEPAALDLALSNLAVDYVLVTPPVAGWAPLLSGRPGWRLVACDGHGLLFHREAGNIPLPDAERHHLASVRDALDGRGDPIWAFAYSSLIDPLSVSLTLLDRSDENQWTEPFFNNLSRWLADAPATELKAFLHVHPTFHNLLLHDLILRQTQAPSSTAHSTSQLGKSLHILNLLDQHDLVDALKRFAVLPQPMASSLYYEVRDRLRLQAGLPPAPAHAAEDWQDWNRGGPELFHLLAPMLNRQLSIPVQ